MLYLKGRAYDKTIWFHISHSLQQIQNLSHLILTNITASEQNYNSSGA